MKSGAHSQVANARGFRSELRLSPFWRIQTIWLIDFISLEKLNCQIQIKRVSRFKLRLPSFALIMTGVLLMTAESSDTTAEAGAATAAAAATEAAEAQAARPLPPSPKPLWLKERRARECEDFRRRRQAAQAAEASLLRLLNDKGKGGKGGKGKDSAPY